MECPICNSRTDVKKTVSNSEDWPGEVIRHRRCPRCGWEFKTAEALDRAHLRVMKSDGETVPFSRLKLGDSIRKASPYHISDEELESMVSRIVRKLMDEPPRDRVFELTSVGIRQATMDVLKDVDARTYIRYCLVAKRHPTVDEWESLDDFVHWLTSQYPDLKSVEDEFRQDGVGEQPMLVCKRPPRAPEAFSKSKLAKGIGYAAKYSKPIDTENRDSERRTRRLADDVADAVAEALRHQPIVTTGQIGDEVLRQLRNHAAQDPRVALAWIRYASYFKGYAAPADYFREALALNEALRGDRAQG